MQKIESMIHRFLFGQVERQNKELEGMLSTKARLEELNAVLEANLVRCGSYLELDST